MPLHPIADGLHLLARLGVVERRLIAFDLTAWYLHSMTALWLYLFVFLTVA